MPPHSSSRGYFGELKEKHQLLDTSKSPRIIFIGGSNLALGLDSGYIEQKFQKPVVNMGLCSLFGLRFILEEVADRIHPGDLIVLVPEYGLLQDPVLIDGCYDLEHAIEVYPQSIIIIVKAYSHSLSGIFKLLGLLQHILVAKCRAFYLIDLEIWHGQFSIAESTRKEMNGPNGLPDRYCYDKYGDYLGHLRQPNSPGLPPSCLLKAMNKDAVSLLNNFDKLVQQHGAKVVIIPCPIPYSYSTFSAPSARFNWADKHLSIPLLAHIDRYIMPDSCFYQKPYHLNENGRIIRTRLIAEDLDRYFQKTNLLLSTKASRVH